MMNAQDRRCAQCGRSNSPTRIWCEECRAGLSLPPNVDVSSDVASRDGARKHLYEQVLRDLDQLSDAGEVPVATSSLVGEFYRKRLAEINGRQAERAKWRSIGQLADSARNAALGGRYDRAIEVLQRGIETHPHTSLFGEMLSEVRARSEEERAREASGEAERLIQSANQLTQRGLLEAAKSKLQRAVSLDPSNVDAMTALKELEVRLSGAEFAGLPDSGRDQEDASDEIPVATLIEPADVSAPAVPAEVPAEVPGEIAAEAEVSEPISFETARDQGDLTSSAASAQPSEAEAQPSELVARYSQTAAQLSGATSKPREVAAPTAQRSFAEEEEIPSPTQRLIDSASEWSSVLKPFLLDNVGWFVGAFLVIAGFVVLIVSFWGSIEQNQILVHSIVYFSLLGTTGMFFAMAYFMRMKYPQLESSSNVLMVIVTLLIPLVFAAAVLTTLVPATPAEIAIPMSAG